MVEDIASSYADGLMKALKDPEEARAYLNAAIEDGSKAVLLVALWDLIGVWGG